MRPRHDVTPDEYFSGFEASRLLFDAVRDAAASVAPSELRVTKSQIAFVRIRSFAWAWVPDRYLRGGNAPLVLSVALARRDDSVRWKQVVEPAPGRFMHHLEVWEESDIDEDVRAWLREAWTLAGP